MLVQGEQGLVQEGGVLRLEGDGEAVDDAAEDLEELPDAVVVGGLVDEGVEDVVDRLADVGAVGHEFAVDAMEYCFQVVPLAGVLTVKQVY